MIVWVINTSLGPVSIFWLAGEHYFGHLIGQKVNHRSGPLTLRFCQKVSTYSMPVGEGKISPGPMTAFFCLIPTLGQ